MAEPASDPPPPGTILWTDLTVQDADRLRDFYSQVVGWRPEPVVMDGYADYNMNSPVTGKPAAGICFERGVNSGIPAQWLMYIVVADLDASLQRCQGLGGSVVHGPRGDEAQGRLVVIKDPAGAYVALIELAQT
jgi:predicted enzyme related to lactoylglutathione lyase